MEIGREVTADNYGGLVADLLKPWTVAWRLRLRAKKKRPQGSAFIVV